MDFISDNAGETYNMCHCKIVRFHGRNNVIDALNPVWSNFEIADMDFWRSEAYTKFFEYLEATGGFYYEVSSECLFFLRVR